MRQLVSVQVGLLVEALVAAGIGTHEWFFASMYSHVSFEVEIEREALSANVALVWLLSCVHKHVSL